jgi:hypothetical protein
MRKGVAEAICIKEGHNKTAYDWIRDAHKNGRASGLALPTSTSST